MSLSINVGVLALQGAFIEHIRLLNDACKSEYLTQNIAWSIRQIRTKKELEECDALIIPGGESTTVSLVAARSGLMEPLRQFIKKDRKPVWGTCAGLILLAESANRTKKGGQDLLGGLDVRVNRNYFGRQTESFETKLQLDFLSALEPASAPQPFNGVFIRAPVVENLLLPRAGEHSEEAQVEGSVIAPSLGKTEDPVGAHSAPVEVMATLPGRSRSLEHEVLVKGLGEEIGDIVAVRQGNAFGTSFHPELTDDPRIHVWWLRQVQEYYQNPAREVR